MDDAAKARHDMKTAGYNAAIKEIEDNQITCVSQALILLEPHMNKEGTVDKYALPEWKRALCDNLLRRGDPSGGLSIAVGLGN